MTIVRTPRGTRLDVLVQKLRTLGANLTIRVHRQAPIVLGHCPEAATVTLLNDSSLATVLGHNHRKHVGAGSGYGNWHDVATEFVGLATIAN